MLRRIGLKLRALLRKEAVERELDEELRFHLQMEAERNIRRGMSPERARLEAKRGFGGVEQVKERCRDARGLRPLENLAQNLRYGTRMLLKRPGFTAMALLVLALGIGANTAVFSMVCVVLLRPLPYGNGERLVVLNQSQPLAGVESIGFSPKEIADYRTQSQTLDGVVEYHSMTFTLLGRAEPQRVQTGVVSADFFEVFGVQPLLGRTFLPGEDAHGSEAVLILSHGYWQRAFQGAPDVIGQTVEMNDRIHTIVGVLPALPQYPDENDVYMPTSHCPFRSRDRVIQSRQARMLAAFGRLKPGVPLQEAQAELSAIGARFLTQYPEDYPKEHGLAVAAEALHEELSRSFRQTLLVLLGTALFVLLIVCANVANLTLARVVTRERELAVRSAMGAGRSRLVRQLLTESALLGLAGGALGLLLAHAGMDLLVAFAERFTARAAEIRIDGAVLIFTLLVSSATGLAFGILPALMRRNLVQALKEGSDRSGSGQSRQRARGVLLAAQLSFTFLLLIGAGLMIRSLVKLQRVDPGFNPENVLTMRLDLNWSKYTNARERLGFFEPLLEKVAVLPGVRSAAVSAAIPLNDTFRFNQDFQIEGRPRAEGQPALQADFRIASEDYFGTIGQPLLAGRGFTERDNAEALQVAIVNQSMARRYWGQESPVGQRISFDGGENWRTIVGVVGDVRHFGLATEAVEEIYRPLRQSPPLSMALLVRTTTEPMSALRSVREAVRSLDPEQPVAFVQTLEQVRDNSIASPRLTTILLGLLAGLALTVAAAGLGSVLALLVSQRTHEIGVRMALGATRGQVLRLVMRQALAPVLAGLGLGAAGALALSRVMSGLLFGVGPADPLTFAGVSLVLLAAAAAAGLIPARRATSIDPMAALRVD
jgi:predicted permease